jgi:hypothetical protein
MNDPEVAMLDALTTTDLVAHLKALEAAGTAIKLVIRVPTPLKSIADQVIRSASSVPANLAEGQGRSGRDRQHFWRIAYASAKEGARNGWVEIRNPKSEIVQRPSHKFPYEPNVRTSERRTGGG